MANPRGKICVQTEGGKTDQKEGPQTAYRDFEMIGFSDRPTAEVALLQYYKATYQHDEYPELVRDTWSIDEVPSHPGEWQAKMEWKRYIPDLIGDEKLSGSVGIQTVKQQFVQGNGGRHISDWGPGGGVPTLNSNGALGLKNSNGVWVAEGADIEFPVVTFTIKKTYSKGYGAISLAVALNDYVGRPNSHPWRGFGIQTVKLTSANIDDEDDNEDAVSYSFAASPTVMNIKIPTLFGTGLITIPQKLGWQTVSITSAPKPVGGETIESAYAAHVDELTPLANYNNILP